MTIIARNERQTVGSIDIPDLQWVDASHLSRATDTLGIEIPARNILVMVVVLLEQFSWPALVHLRRRKEELTLRVHTYRVKSTRL